jgi:four helix bundle protein
MKTAESVPLTLVEGCGAFTQKEMARFVEMSIKSTKELEYQLFLARDYGVLPRNDWKTLTAETIEIRRMLCGLRRRVLGGDDREEA